MAELASVLRELRRSQERLEFILLFYYFPDGMWKKKVPLDFHPPREEHFHLLSVWLSQAHVQEKWLGRTSKAGNEFQFEF